MPDDTVPLKKAGARAPGPIDLFLGFLFVSAVSFGTMLPWVRRMLVERRGWLTEQEFADLLALCHLTPGMGVVNMSVAVGQRFAGAAGAVAGWLGLIVLPLAIVLALGDAYGRFGELEVVRRTLSGVAAAAVGLIVALTAKMAMALLARRWREALPFMLLAFIGVALLRLPLLSVLATLAPLSIAVSWWRRG